MQQTVLEAHPDARLAALIIWVPMLASDSEKAARETANLVHDPRATHFYDARRRAASAVAASVGGAGQAAWDTYLFYRPGEQWGNIIPSPARWMHQLGESGWADPARYRWAESLSDELAAAAAMLLRPA